jgi:hypothetical protein
MNSLESCDAQVRALATFFDELTDRHELLPQVAAANDDLALHIA